MTTGPRLVRLEMARDALLYAETALEAAGLEALAFEIGLKADELYELLAEALDDGGMTE
jgi:hypothetical protein